MVNNIHGMRPTMGSDTTPRSESLTTEQQSTIKIILSQYDPDNVTTDDAKSIFQAFKDAGIRPSRGMKETIESTGFDAEDLRIMGMPAEGAPPPPPAARMGSSSKSSGINISALQSLQETLSLYDLTNLSEDDAKSLTSKLQELGFMDSGSLIDLKS